MKKTEFALLGVDALCAGLFSAGAGLAVLPLLGFPAAAGPLAAGILLLLGLFALSERRPWVIFAVLAGVGILAAGLAALTGNTEIWASAALGYIRQAVEETAGGQPRFIVYLGTAFPITLLFWVILRWRRLPDLPVLWLLTLLAAWIIGWKAFVQPDGWTGPFVLLLGGLALFLPRATLQGDGRLQAQLLAALLAVPVLGLAFLLGPQSDGSWKSVGVRHLVQDTQDFWEFHWGDLPSLPFSSMGSMGLQPQADRLGGDIELGDQVILTSGQQMLLRGQVLDLYTGTGWEDSSRKDNGNFRLDSLLWKSRRREAFGLNMPRTKNQSLLDELLTDVSAEITCRRRLSSVLLPYRTGMLEPLHGGELYFDMQGEVYWSQQPNGNMAYRVEARTWNFRAKSFDRNMIRLEDTLRPIGKDPLYSQVAETCLQLPDTLPDWVRQLAADLTYGSRTPYSRVIVLRDYLSKTCEYTLTPGPTDPDMDFVAEFLTRRKGYCTYYASALTVLCRCAGVPARYVTGYGMVSGDRHFQATEATAHTWTEVYLEHIGWVPVDVLTQDVFERNIPLPEEPAAEDIAQDTPDDLSPDPDLTDGELWDAEPEKKGFNPLRLLWLLILPLTAGAGLTVKYLYIRRYMIKYVNSRFARTDQAAEHCYAGILRLLRPARLRPQPGETLLTFWAQMAERLPDETDWLEIGRVMDRLRFGSIVPGKDEIAMMCRAHHALREYIRKLYGFWGRLMV